jgi:hypothetical protein
VSVPEEMYGDDQRHCYLSSVALLTFLLIDDVRDLHGDLSNRSKGIRRIGMLAES